MRLRTGNSLPRLYVPQNAGSFVLSRLGKILQALEGHGIAKNGDIFRLHCLSTPSESDGPFVGSKKGLLGFWIGLGVLVSLKAARLLRSLNTDRMPPFKLSSTQWWLGSQMADASDLTDDTILSCFALVFFMTVR